MAGKETKGNGGVCGELESAGPPKGIQNQLGLFVCLFLFSLVLFV